MRITLLFIPLFFAAKSYSVEKSNVNTNAGFSFVKNNGQIIDMNRQPRPDVMYTGNSGGAKIYLHKTSLNYVYTEKESSEIKPGALTISPEKKAEELKNKVVKGCRCWKIS